MNDLINLDNFHKHTYFPLPCSAGVSWCCVVCRSEAAQYGLAADDGGGATNERRAETCH